MSKQALGITLFFVFSLAGCKKAVVDLKAMKSISGFSIDQSNVVAKQVSNPNFSVSGRCNKNLPRVEVSFDGGTKWYDLTAVAAATISCIDSGSFSATFNKDLTSVVNLEVVKRLGGIYFRGTGDLGSSEQMFLLVKDGAFGGLPTAIVAAAAYGTTVGGYKVRAGILSGSTNSYQHNPAGAPGYTVKNLRVEAVK